MKKITLSLVFLVIGFTAVNAQLTDTEREATVAELMNTHDALLASVEGLSDAQLNYKSTPESWSVAECVEHLAISENNIFGMATGALETPADASKRGDVAMTDDKLMAGITDRSGKIKTGEAFEPSGKFGSFDETLKAFVSKRVENLEFAKTTDADLRNHYAQSPFGTIDAAQVLWFMSGHTNRHTQQIEEVKATEGFPAE